MVSPLEIFCCYARKDQSLLNELKIHLSPLQRRGLITIWSDIDIDAGAEWEEEIKKHLNTAQIILLLISPDFMASEYCYSIEMQRALERHEQKEAHVIPILLRPTIWKDAPFDKLQILPNNAKPVMDRRIWLSEDEALNNVAEGIHKAVKKLIPKVQKTGTSTVESQSVYALSSRKNNYCPFCFSSFSLKELSFRCLYPSCSGRAPDAIYAAARGFSATPMGRMLTPPKRAFASPKVAFCDVCLRETSTRICPDCHFEFPHDVGQIDQCIIAIIGGTNAGKSHYIASLVMRLQQEVGKNFDFSVRTLDDSAKVHWEQDYYYPVFVRKTVLPPTRPGAIDTSTKVPLIFRLTFNNGSYKRAINLNIYDTAGDDMTSLDALSAHAPCIWHADGIIFLLDPLQISSVRQQLPGMNAVNYGQMAAPEYIIGGLRNLFERQNNLPVDEKIKTPIAFALSKVDLLRPLLYPGSSINRHGNHFGKLDFYDLQSMNTEIVNYLYGWINPNFCNIVRSNFSSYLYFGVSSLGRQPDNNNRLVTVSPFRVEDPFLWILYKFGLIELRRKPK